MILDLGYSLKREGRKRKGWKKEPRAHGSESASRWIEWKGQSNWQNPTCAMVHKSVRKIDYQYAIWSLQQLIWEHLHHPHFYFQDQQHKFRPWHIWHFSTWNHMEMPGPCRTESPATKSCPSCWWKHRNRNDQKNSAKKKIQSGVPFNANESDTWSPETADHDSIGLENRSVKRAARHLKPAVDFALATFGRCTRPAPDSPSSFD